MSTEFFQARQNFFTQSEGQMKEERDRAKLHFDQRLIEKYKVKTEGIAGYLKYLSQLCSGP